MENKVSLWKEDGLAIAALILALASFEFPDEARDAEIAARIEQEVAEKKADLRPEDRIALIPPVGCGQTIAKRGANEHWRVYHICADATRERQ